MSAASGGQCFNPNQLSRAAAQPAVSGFARVHPPTHLKPLFLLLFLALPRPCRVLNTCSTKPLYVFLLTLAFSFLTLTLPLTLNSDPVRAKRHCVALYRAAPDFNSPFPPLCQPLALLLDLRRQRLGPFYVYEPSRLLFTSVVTSRVTKRCHLQQEAEPLALPPR